MSSPQLQAEGSGIEREHKATKGPLTLYTVSSVW